MTVCPLCGDPVTIDQPRQLVNHTWAHAHCAKKERKKAQTKDQFSWDEDA